MRIINMKLKAVFSPTSIVEGYMIKVDDTAQTPIALVAAGRGIKQGMAQARRKAEEIVKRWNAYKELLSTLEQVDGFFDALGKYTRDYPGADFTHNLIKETLVKVKS